MFFLSLSISICLSVCPSVRPSVCRAARRCSRQQLLLVHVGLLHRVAHPVVRVAHDQQPVLAVDHDAAAAAQYALPAALDVLSREHHLMVRAHEHGDQRQRAGQHQPVREQRHGRVRERGGHVHPPVDVFGQVTDTLQREKTNEARGRA